ncbi:3-deoxy-D-manno-octulosonic acid transferase [Pseudaestuariivita atlantica]|uniref:3-deoxy-D-manno-octulosonic acid transferase n=1 Tax=Pseudaestuariivita atlantica TaxID=1317121 RepID=A0A0L1JQA0_9RHOB|nr:glycosyltransferase N-terminal domain-containing protein [Pseudaestuariivita atlantica]KNG93588.1 hypothetical protein ATO11_10260 [Pseudaestuariivita atlantica]
MRHSLTLTAELVLRGRKEAGGSRIYAPRPAGEVVWLHIGVEAVADIALPLIDRLVTQRPGLTVVMTTAPGLAARPDPREDVIGAGELPEKVRDAKGFVEHFAPDMGLWVGGALAAPALAAAAEADVPMALISAVEDGVPVPGFRWGTSVVASLLPYFSAIYAETANAERRLASYGVDPDHLFLSGPMQVGTVPPPCNEAELEALRDTTRNRTLWSALHVRADEVAMIVEAHQLMARLAPRALMILQGEGPGFDEALAAAQRGSPLVFADRDEGEDITEAVQVLVTREVETLGLWQRLAPVTILGSSLTRAHVGRSPWPAASLGSAIICGPHVAAHRGAYARLQHAGAARSVETAQELATALSHLSAPDRAAAMAHAGWQIATAGALATDMVVDLVQDTLDAGGGA